MPQPIPRAGFFVADPAAPEPNRPRLVGVVLITLSPDRDRVLLEHRTDSDLWSLIGGGVDDDESVLTALRREVREETGCVLATASLMGVFSDPSRILAYPDGNVMQSLTLAFVGDLAGGEPAPSSESTELRYVAWSELPSLPIAATHLAILREAADRCDGAAEIYCD